MNNSQVSEKTLDPVKAFSPLLRPASSPPTSLSPSSLLSRGVSLSDIHRGHSVALSSRQLQSLARPETCPVAWLFVGTALKYSFCPLL